MLIQEVMTKTQTPQAREAQRLRVQAQRLRDQAQQVRAQRSLQRARDALITAQQTKKNP